MYIRKKEPKKQPHNSVYPFFFLLFTFLNWGTVTWAFQVALAVKNLPGKEPL